jgi:hypothetical protein
MAAAMRLLAAWSSRVGIALRPQLRRAVFRTRRCRVKLITASNDFKLRSICFPSRGKGFASCWAVVGLGAVLNRMRAFALAFAASSK